MFEYFWNSLIPNLSFLYKFQLYKLIQIQVHHFENSYFHLELKIPIFDSFDFKTNLPSYFPQIFKKIIKPSCEYKSHSLRVEESIARLLVFLKKSDKN